MRTIVLSDLHGYTWPLERAIEDADLRAEDELIVAGDLIDIGHEDSLAAARAAGATVLVGNHEVAAAVGLTISPQDPESLRRGPEFAERMISGEWKLARATQGWLVTHAGVSSAFLGAIRVHDQSAEALADHINRLFVEEITDAVASSPLDWWAMERYQIIGGHAGPLWYRPLHTAKLPPRLRQIVGHTPAEAFEEDELAALARAGWLLVDPGGHPGPLGARHPGTTPGFRYALIEDGNARIVHG